MVSVNGTRGVVASTSLAPKEYGPNRSVDSIIEMKQYIVKFFDDSGNAHVDVLVRIGDEYYASPFGEEWCAKLGPVQRWLKDIVHRRIEAKTSSGIPDAVPALDSVSMTGSKLAEVTKAVVESLR